MNAKVRELSMDEIGFVSGGDAREAHLQRTREKDDGATTCGIGDDFGGNGPTVSGFGNQGWHMSPDTAKKVADGIMEGVIVGVTSIAAGLITSPAAGAAFGYYAGKTAGGVDTGGVPDPNYNLPAWADPTI